MLVKNPRQASTDSSPKLVQKYLDHSAHKKSEVFEETNLERRGEQEKANGN